MGPRALQQQTRAADTVVVLVHGAWHSSLHWAALQRELAGHGVASVAPELPGHELNAPVPSGYLLPGQPDVDTERSAAAGVTLQDGADVVLRTLAAARRRFAKIVVIAHSAGGKATSLAAEQAPELIDRLIYLASVVPAARPRFQDYIDDPVNAEAVTIPRIGVPTEIGAYRINPLSPDPALVDPLRIAFLDELDSDAPDGWRRMLHPDEPYATLSEPVTLTTNRWGRIPRSYIKLEGDRALLAATQQLMIDEADTITPDAPFEVHTLPGGHSPFVTRPVQLGGLVARIAGS